MLLFIINNQLYFIIALVLLFIFFAIKVYRYEAEEENIGDEVNILGFGKAEGLYLVKVGKYYLVAGIKIKSKHKAIKKFIALVEKNGFVPPKSYFKMVKVKNL